MNEYMFDLNPVQHIIADAVGQPGQRTFFLQGRAGPELLSLLLEKEEVANLAISILQLLEDLEEKFPDLPPLAEYIEVLYPEQPVEPRFRIGHLVVGYNKDEDRIWIIAKAHETPETESESEDDLPSARFVATREQMRVMSEHALEVVAQGRPTCPLCNNTVDRDGHFCPRTDGEAMPIVF